MNKEGQGVKLTKALEDAEAEVARLKAAIAGAPCSEVGCDMQQVGGKNAGCCGPETEYECDCSVPVYVCTRCGDSDYGENAEAEAIITACAEERSAAGWAAYSEAITEGGPPEWAGHEEDLTDAGRKALETSNG